MTVSQKTLYFTDSDALSQIDQHQQLTDELLSALEQERAAAARLAALVKAADEKGQAMREQFSNWKEQASRAG